MAKTKNIVLTIMALAASILLVSANETGKLKSEAKNNWFISLGAGPNLLIGEQDFDVSSGQRIQLGGEFSVGKWFNPNFGVRVQAYGGSLKGFNYLDSNRRGGKYTRPDRAQNPYPTGYYADKLKPANGDDGPGFWQEFDAASASFDVMMNLTTLFRGYYKENNLIDIIPFIGMGYQHGFWSNTNPAFNGFVGKFGARVTINFSNTFSVYLEPQANATSTELDGYIGNRDIDAYVAGLAGVQFNINKGFATPAGYSLSQDEINILNERINDQRYLLDNQQEIMERQQQLLNELRNQQQQQQQQQKPAIQSDNMNQGDKGRSFDNINFKLDSFKIEESEQYKLRDMAAYMKANPQSRFLLIGYADKQTGNSAHNYQLSCRRAENVANQLKNLGISGNRLIIQCVGDKAQPFEENDWNRVVITVERK